MKNFKDIFAASLDEELFKRALAKVRANPLQVVADRSIGEAVVESINHVMATESVQSADAQANHLGRMVMAVESAQSELSRLNGISYSVALRHQSVLGIEVTPDNFTTHVSKKNYDMATENIKALALIGLSAVIIAGLGFIVFKLISSSKKKANGAKDVVKANKEIEKSSKLFSSIDLSTLPEEARNLFMDKMEESLHPLVKGVLQRQDYLTHGYAAMVASSAYSADINTIEAYRFGAKENSWLIKPYLDGAAELNRHIKALIEVFESVGKESRDVIAVKAQVLDKSLGEQERKLRMDLGIWSRENGGVVDEKGESFIEEIEASSNMSTRMMADDMLKRIELSTEVPDDKLYDQFNKQLDESTKLGKQLEDTYNQIPRDKLDDDAMAFLNTIVENFKFVVSGLDDLAYIVRVEASALGTIYGYRGAGAKNYVKVINEVLTTVEDKDVVKKINEQIKKAVSELPKRRIALESIEDQFASGMATEGLSKTAKIGLIAGVGAGIFAIALIGLATLLIKCKDKSKAKGDRLEKKFDALAEELNPNGPAVDPEKIKTYLSGGRQINKGVQAALESDRSSRWEPTITGDGQADMLTKSIGELKEAIHSATNVAKSRSGQGVNTINGLDLDKFQSQFELLGGVTLLVNLMNGSPEAKELLELQKAFAKTPHSQLKADSVRDFKGKVSEILASFTERETTMLSPEETAKVKVNINKHMVDEYRSSNQKAISEVAVLDKKVRPAVEGLSDKVKLDGDEFKAARAASEQYREGTDLIKAACEFVAYCIQQALALVDTYQNQLKRIVDVLDGALGKQEMATESIDWQSELKEPGVPAMATEALSPVVKGVLAAGAAILIGTAIYKMMGSASKAAKTVEKADNAAEVLKRVEEGIKLKEDTIAMIEGTERELPAMAVDILTGEVGFDVVNMVQASLASLASFKTIIEKGRHVIEVAVSGRTDGILNAANDIKDSALHVLGKVATAMHDKEAAQAMDGFVKRVKDVLENGDEDAKDKMIDDFEALVAEILTKGKEMVPHAEVVSRVKAKYFGRWVGLSKNDNKYIAGHIKEGMEKELESAFAKMIPQGVSEKDFHEALKKTEEGKKAQELMGASCGVVFMSFSLAFGLVGLFAISASGLADMIDKQQNKTDKSDMATEGLWLPEPKGPAYTIGLESLQWGDQGPFFGSGDGIDLVLREAEEFLALPEYSQAGYRFDPRDGWDGASVMAMESWSTGAKVAVGLAAAVGLLGIGALIASTIIKRSSSSRDSHASKGHIEITESNWKRLDDTRETLGESVNAMQRRATNNKEYMLANPEFNKVCAELLTKVRSAKSYYIQVDGQSVPIGQAIIKDLGGHEALVIGTKLSEFNSSRPPQTALTIDKGDIADSLRQLYENVIEEPIRELELGRSDEVVLEKLNAYLTRTGNHMRDRIMGQSDDPLLEMLAQADANWFPRGDYNANMTEVLTEPLEFLSIAKMANNQLLDLNEQIGEELGKFNVDERMLTRFQAIEEKAKGTRSATASILRRIEEFKAPFAIFVRVLRRDQENIDRFLSFIDRYLKAMNKYGKVVTDEYAMVKAKVDEINAELDKLNR